MKTIEERFFSKVNKIENGCWEWKGCTVDGYGQFAVSSKNIVKAHRYSYYIHKGEITNNLYVCHSCDNRKCVNPKHLFLGSNLENMKDKTNKGRQCKGSNRPASKLTENDVLEIRTLLTNGMKQIDIVNKYNISIGTVSQIKSKKSWKHI